jgi:hypothetical protein
MTIETKSNAMTLKAVGVAMFFLESTSCKSFMLHGYLIACQGQEDPKLLDDNEEVHISE